MDKFTYRVWTAKAAFSGTSRGFAVGFVLSDKFYLGTGYDLNAAVRDDFWMFDPSTNAWSQKADFGGASRNGAIGFALGSYGYIGLGYSGAAYLKDFWRYDPSGNSWSQKADFNDERYCASSFALSSYGYVGLGDTPGGGGPSNTWWRYDPSGNAWSQKADFGGSARDSASAFTIGSYAYVGCGWPASGVMVKDWWRYSENSWSQMADLTGYARYGACGFSIGSDGYLVGGDLHPSLGRDVRDAYKYDVTGNSWSGIADYGSSSFKLKYLVGVGIGTEGYVATGIQGSFAGGYAFSNANYEFNQVYMSIS
jgi:N-acetylneuraminic acid mutarotase